MFTSSFKTFSVAALAALLLGAPLYGQDDAAAVAMERMREALRTTTLQLRTAQNELAAARVHNDSLKAENEQLQALLARLRKESSAYKTAAEANIENLNTQLTAKEAEAARLAASLKQWQDGYAKAAAIARGKERERAGLTKDLMVAERRMGELRTQNMELFKLGTEILNRYEDFGLGRAIKAREPFTGLARAKLQEQVQDYRDGLAVGRERLSGNEDTALASAPAAVENESGEQDFR